MLEQEDNKNHLALWAAVLERAIDDLQSNNRLDRDDAYGWFNRMEEDGVGSFVWVCSVLNYDPPRTRRKIFSNESINNQPQ